MLIAFCMTDLTRPYRIPPNVTPPSARNFTTLAMENARCDQAHERKRCPMRRQFHIYAVFHLLRCTKFRVRGAKEHGIAWPVYHPRRRCSKISVQQGHWTRSTVSLIGVSNAFLGVFSCLFGVFGERDKYAVNRGFRFIAVRWRSIDLMYCVRLRCFAARRVSWRGNCVA